MPTTAVLTQDCERLNTSTPLFRLSLAQNIDDLTACQRLRYQVFNCELGEGFADSHDTGLDRDCFDVVCDHLMVHDSATGMLVGTYRMQTGYRAQGNLGYYSRKHGWRRARYWISFLAIVAASLTATEFEMTVLRVPAISSDECSSSGRKSDLISADKE